MLHIMDEQWFVFLLMAFPRLFLCGEVPIASKAARAAWRVFGAVCGALVALFVLELLSVLIEMYFFVAHVWTKKHHFALT